MDIPSEIQPFWTEFEATLAYDASARFYEAFHFDEREQITNYLTELVLQGKKRATAGLLWVHEVTNKPIPQVGDLSVVTNWQKAPLCVIETTHVEIVPYEEVSEAFAAREGEGDSSLAEWRKEHWLYFSLQCQRIGREPTMRMPIVCESFRMVYPMQNGIYHPPSVEAIPNQ